MKCMEYKGYIGSVEVDFNGNFLHGKLLHIRDLVTYEGVSPEELMKAFEESVDFYLEDCAKAGEEPDKPFKGSFNVRISPELHKELAMCARSSGRSLNDYIGFVLRNHHSYDTHRKAAEAATEAAWIAMSGFGHPNKAVEPQLVIRGSTIRHYQRKTIGSEGGKSGTLEFKPMRGAELMQ